MMFAFNYKTEMNQILIQSILFKIMKLYHKIQIWLIMTTLTNLTLEVMIKLIRNICDRTNPL